MSISTSICGIKLGSCFMNASGCWCMTEKELDELYSSQIGCIVSKSGTITSRDGNKEPRFYMNDYGSINSMGLPNQGYQFYLEYGNKINFPYIQSIYPFNVDELETMLYNINNKVNSQRLIEINLSCPNIVSSKETHTFENYEKSFDKIKQMKVDNLILGTKLPPFYELNHFDIMANLLLKYDIRFITCINSVVNGLIIDLVNEETVIAPKNGLGGIGGLYCKPIALSNVYNFHKLIGDKIDIIGCGGISTANDAFEYILCGAKAVQIGTHLVRNNPDIFGELNKNLEKILINKNYDSLELFRGKIRVKSFKD